MCLASRILRWRRCGRRGWRRRGGWWEPRREGDGGRRRLEQRGVVLFRRPVEDLLGSRAERGVGRHVGRGDIGRIGRVVEPVGQVEVVLGVLGNGPGELGLGLSGVEVVALEVGNGARELEGLRLGHAVEERPGALEGGIGRGEGERGFLREGELLPVEQGRVDGCHVLGSGQGGLLWSLRLRSKGSLLQAVSIQDQTPVVVVRDRHGVPVHVGPVDGAGVDGGKSRRLLLLVLLLLLFPVLRLGESSREVGLVGDDGEGGRGDGGRRDGGSGDRGIEVRRAVDREDGGGGEGSRLQGVGRVVGGGSEAVLHEDGRESCLKRRVVRRSADLGRRLVRDHRPSTAGPLLHVANWGPGGQRPVDKVTLTQGKRLHPLAAEVGFSLRRVHRAQASPAKLVLGEGEEIAHNALVVALEIGSPSGRHLEVR